MRGAILLLIPVAISAIRDLVGDIALSFRRPNDLLRPDVRCRSVAPRPRGRAVGMWAYCSDVVAMSLLAGCSIDTHGLARVQHYETPTARVVILEALGAHLATPAADRGLSLGWSKHLYAYPKDPGDLDPTAANRLLLELQAGDHRLVPTENDGESGLPSEEEPVIVGTERFGLAVEANERRVGVIIGSQQMLSLVVDPASSGLLFLQITSDRPEESIVFMQGIRR